MRKLKQYELTLNFYATTKLKVWSPSKELVEDIAIAQMQKIMPNAEIDYLETYADNIKEIESE
jgi:hypothetical protein